jgi:hypothetical protein
MSRAAAAAAAAATSACRYSYRREGDTPGYAGKRGRILYLFGLLFFVGDGNTGHESIPVHS